MSDINILLYLCHTHTHPQMTPPPLHQHTIKVDACLAHAQAIIKRLAISKPITIHQSTATGSVYGNERVDALFAQGCKTPNI